MDSHVACTPRYDGISLTTVNFLSRSLSAKIRFICENLRSNFTSILQPVYLKLLSFYAAFGDAFYYLFARYQI